ncbi:MAG: pilus assembly protein [Novosphingobium sp.]|nr:pilus assembly protein [Novosphingobium sp.]
MSKRRSLLRRLRKSVSGLAATEMALTMPLMLAAGLGGVELANYGVTIMRVNQLAVQVADNASRIGDESKLANSKIYESDIMDLLRGAHIQGGTKISLFDHGRVIISSLEVDPADPDGEDQYIHWQRCMGEKTWTSTYGNVGDHLPTGMGPSGREVITFDDEAVMFVEIAYDYQPLISAKFVGEPTIQSIASFTVRSARDLSGIYQRDPGSPDPVADCGTYTSPFAPYSGGGASGDGGGGSSSGGGNSGSNGGGNSGSNGGSNGGGNGNGNGGGNNA